jgi:hypothetical protein
MSASDDHTWARFEQGIARYSTSCSHKQFVPQLMCRDEEILALEEELLLLQKRVGPIADYKESLSKARTNTTEAMETFVRHLAQGSKINDSIDETIGEASRELEATHRSAAEISVSVQSAHEEVRSSNMYAKITHGTLCSLGK